MTPEERAVIDAALEYEEKTATWLRTDAEEKATATSNGLAEWAMSTVAEARASADADEAESKMFTAISAYRAAIKGAAIPSVDIPTRLDGDGELVNTDNADGNEFLRLVTSTGFEQRLFFRGAMIIPGPGKCIVGYNFPTTEDVGCDCVERMGKAVKEFCEARANFEEQDGSNASSERLEEAEKTLLAFFPQPAANNTPTPGTP
jgi:hypothetical protein